MNKIYNNKDIEIAVFGKSSQVQVRSCRLEKAAAARSLSHKDRDQLVVVAWRRERHSWQRDVLDNSL